MTAAAPITCGFYGKLPSRGDFCRAGLPRDFIDAWDGWLQNGLAASRDQLGAAWLPAWMEAPIWRFALAAGVCGAAAVVGLWLPSVDRAGRHFPLTLAASSAVLGAADLLATTAGVLTALEQAGLAALDELLTPEALAQLVAEAIAAPAAAMEPAAVPPKGTLWWTDGSPRVAPCARRFGGLPSAAEFATFLTAPALSAITEGNTA
jgi:type VI secretion system protein ImpM